MAYDCSGTQGKGCGHPHPVRREVGTTNGVDTLVDTVQQAVSNPAFDDLVSDAEGVELRSRDHGMSRPRKRHDRREQPI